MCEKVMLPAFQFSRVIKSFMVENYFIVMAISERAQTNTHSASTRCLHNVELIIIFLHQAFILFLRKQISIIKPPPHSDTVNMKINYELAF